MDSMLKQSKGLIDTSFTCQTQESTPKSSFADIKEASDMSLIIAAYLDGIIQSVLDDRKKYPSVNLEITKQLDIFYIKKESKLSLHKYIMRIFDYAQIEFTTSIYALLILKKFLLKNEHISLCLLNVNLLYLLAVVISVKLLEDKIFTNSFYASVGGISKDKLNQLEIIMLNFLDFNIHISPLEYEEFNNEILCQLKS